MIKLFAFLILVSSSSVFASDLDIIDIVESKDRNFNGIYRGMGVFQDILERDYNASNDKGLIKIQGSFEPKELIIHLFKKLDAKANWDKRSSHLVLDRGYINDGSKSPRIPVKLQKVVDLYNSQILGLIRGSGDYKLIIFSMENRDTQGWLLYNQIVNEALWASSTKK